MSVHKMELCLITYREGLVLLMFHLNPQIRIISTAQLSHCSQPWMFLSQGCSYRSQFIRTAGHFGIGMAPRMEVEFPQEGNMY